MNSMSVRHRVVRLGHGGFIVGLPIIILGRNRLVKASIAALGRGQRLLWSGHWPVRSVKYGSMVSYAWATLETILRRQRASV